MPWAMIGGQVGCRGLRKEGAAAMTLLDCHRLLMGVTDHSQVDTSTYDDFKI